MHKPFLPGQRFSTPTASDDYVVNRQSNPPRSTTPILTSTLSMWCLAVNAAQVRCKTLDRCYGRGLPAELLDRLQKARKSAFCLLCLLFGRPWPKIGDFSEAKRSLRQSKRLSKRPFQKHFSAQIHRSGFVNEQAWTSSVWIGCWVMRATQERPRCAPRTSGAHALVS